MPTSFDAIPSFANNTVYYLSGTSTYSPPPATSLDGPTPAAITLQGLSNVTLLGHSATINISTPGHGLCIQDCSDILLEGFTFIGPGKLTTDNGVYCALALLHGQNHRVTFRDCRFLNGANHGIAHLWGARTSYDVTVDHCTFTHGGNFKRTLGVNLGGDGAAIAVGGRGLLVQGCTISDWFRGIEVEGHVTPNDASGVRLLGNRLEGCAWQSILITPTNGDSSTYRRLVVANNVIRGTPIKPEPFSNCGVLVSGCDGLVLAGNTIEDIADGCGILVLTDHGYIRGASIQGNVVRNCGRTGIYCGNGVESAARQNIGSLIQGNNVAACGGVGMHIDGSGWMVAHNRVSDCAYVGLEATGSGVVHCNYFEGNLCRDGKGPVPTQVTGSPALQWDGNLFA